MLKHWLGPCAALAFAASVAPGLAASGTAVGVDPAAEARGTQTRTLVVGADIFIGDRVVTDDRGLVQIMFTDSTRLVVGPRSELLIEDYLLRDNGSAGSFAVNALSGTFRFITGTAAKDRYKITTPTGTIGVRGTAMDFNVQTAATNTMQLHGTSVYCPKGTAATACKVLDEMCHWGILKNDEFEVRGHTDGLTGDERARARTWFMLAGSQNRLLRLFRVQGAERCLNRPPPTAGPAALGSEGTGGAAPRPTDPDPGDDQGGDDNTPPPPNNRDQTQNPTPNQPPIFFVP